MILEGFLSSQSDEQLYEKTYVTQNLKLPSVDPATLRKSESNLSDSDFEQPVQHKSPMKLRERIATPLSSDSELSAKKDEEFAEYL